MLSLLREMLRVVRRGRDEEGALARRERARGAGVAAEHGGVRILARVTMKV